MLHQKNVTRMLLAKSAVVLKPATLTPINDVSDLTDGQVAIVDVNGLAYDNTAASALAKFRFVKRNGNDLIYSDWIVPANIKTAKATSPVADTEQLDYIGYNGTTGEIDVINDNVYKVNLDMRLSYAANAPQQMLKHGVYKSGAAATQEQIAYGLADNLIANFSRDKYFNKELPILIERVNAGTSTATSAGALAVVYGSVTVTIPESAGGANDAGKYNADAGTMVVGDYIRFGHATTKTYPVYKIAAITGAGTSACTITLDIPYQGTTGSVAAASAGVIPVASVDDFGIKLTGRARTNFKPGVFRYMKHRWVTTLVEDFGTTLLTNSTIATEGTNQWEQIAEAEWFYQGNEGNYYRVQVPPFTPRANYEQVANGYYTISLVCVDKSYSTIAGTPELPKETIIAIPAGGDHANYATALSTLTGLTISF